MVLAPLLFFGCSLTHESRRYSILTGQKDRVRCAAIVDQNSCGLQLKDCVGAGDRYAEIRCATNVYVEAAE